MLPMADSSFHDFRNGTFLYGILNEARVHLRICGGLRANTSGMGTRPRPGRGSSTSAGWPGRPGAGPGGAPAGGRGTAAVAGIPDGGRAGRGGGEGRDDPEDCRVPGPTRPLLTGRRGRWATGRDPASHPLIANQPYPTRGKGGSHFVHPA